MKKNLLFILLMSLINLSCSQSQTEKTEEIISTFFNIYQSGEYVKALEGLYTHAPWLTGTNAGVEDLKNKFREMETNNGKYHGYELLNEKNIKNTFVVYTYLVKHENGPLLFTFEFYKPKDVWTLYSFSYDYGFVDDLKESIKKELFEEKQ